MLTIKIGLMDMTGTVDATTMAAAAAAINVQVTRDLRQFWNVPATVAVLPRTTHVPAGFWPVQIVASLPPGEGGFHFTKHNQPYAKVIATPGKNDWTVDASHEILEMLIDPSGNRLQAAPAMQIVGNAIVPAVGRFEYLVEACDPCEADPYTYRIDGIRVSDFITPHFYDAHPLPGARYSFTGAIQKPMQILPGGYISWTDPADQHMRQILWVDPDRPPQLRDLGPASGASLRVFVEGHTGPYVREMRREPDAATKAERHAHVESLESRAKLRTAHYL